MSRKLSAVALSCLALLLAGSALAFVRPEPSPLAEKEVRHPGLDPEPVLARVGELEAGLAADLERNLAALGLSAERAFLDTRSGRWATLWPARPMVPGAGVDNRLTWVDLGFDAAPPAKEMADAAWSSFTTFLADHREQLGIDPAQLDRRVGVGSGGQLIQVHGGRMVDGIPVRGAAVVGTLNHGNLVLLGSERWGAIDVSTRPALGADEAVGRTERHLAPFEPSGYREAPRLEILVLGTDGGFGHGYSHRLAWIVSPDFDGLIQRYEAAIDAHSGEVLSFQDTNHYGSATRNVKGGVYPITYDGLAGGEEVPGYPMPFADLTHGGGTATTDSGGNVSGVGGDMTTDLTGPFIRINDFCGPISETSPEGDLDLGVSPDPDCDTPPGASAGNTHAARSGFYELNRVKEMGRGHWPDPGTPAHTWLNAQLEAQMNISQVCNAFWTGSVVQFYKETPPCANTGQIAGVFDHEWGHGMDDNGTAGTISSPGEGIADIYAALRLDTSCIGRGFFLDGSLCGGYGDPCTPASGCTGIRDIDWANRTSGEPHDVDWVLGNPNCGSSHCRGAVYSEAVWDLLKRDLPTVYGYDSNTAFEVANRLTFLGADNVTTWFITSGGNENGCGASSGYQQFLGVDDDNGNLNDGTPHMQAIYSAFNRHQIACSTPTVQDSGCDTVPTEAPVVEISPRDTGASLSWSPISGAARYKIYRTDGEFQCDFGKTLVGTTTTTSFIDSGLQNGREYSYVVAGFTASDSCMGPASLCSSVVPVAFMVPQNPVADICAGDPATYTITVNSPFEPPVGMSLVGNPAGTTATFDPNPLPGPLPQDTVLTIGNTGAAAPGSYVMTATGDDGVTVFDVDLTLNVYAAAPAAPGLLSPVNGATNVPLRPTFEWAAAAQARTYAIDIAIDPAFGTIVDSASGLTGTSYTPASDLQSNTVHYWRVQAENGCAIGPYSATFSFTTEPLPGDCSVGSLPNLAFDDDFESGGLGWTHSGSGDTWTLSGTRTHSGVNAYYAEDVTVVSDQYLVSPAIDLPADEAPLTLQFWNWQELEDRSGGCYDGSVIEISVDDGATWIRLESELLTDPYDGPVACCSNPLADDNAWCGDPQDWLESIVDLDAFAGQTVRFRFRLGTDSSVGREGWYIDDVVVQSCVGDSVIFADGFESGDTSAWSEAVP